MKGPFMNAVIIYWRLFSFKKLSFLISTFKVLTVEVLYKKQIRNEKESQYRYLCFFFNFYI